MRWIAVCVLAGSALVVGCAKHETAASSAEAGPALVVTVVRQRPGLGWGLPSRAAGPGVSMTGELCLDAANEDSAFSSSGKGFSKDCDPVKYQAADRGFGFTTVCRIGRRTVTTTGTATGDFKSDYLVDISTQMDPAPSGLPARMSTTIRAKWEGPCPTGMKPGQTSMKFSGLGQG